MHLTDLTTMVGTVVMVLMTALVITALGVAVLLLDLATIRTHGKLLEQTRGPLMLSLLQALHARHRGGISGVKKQICGARGVPRRLLAWQPLPLLNLLQYVNVFHHHLNGRGPHQ